MSLHFSLTRLGSLKSRIFFYFVALLLLIQLVAFWAIRLAIIEQEEQRLKSELTSATSIFKSHFSSSHSILNNFNHTSNKILAQYFNDNTKSFLQALENFRSRIDADLAMSIDINGLIKTQLITKQLSDGTSKVRIGSQQGTKFKFTLKWLKGIEENKFYQIDQQLYQFSSSEVRIANIETLGWIGFGNRIDNDSAIRFSKLIGFDINFILTDKNQCTLLATSRQIHKTVNSVSKPLDCISSSAGFEKSELIVLGTLADKKIQAVIYGLRENILSTIQQRWLLLSLLAGLTLFLSLVGAYLIAASISRPVRQLVKQAKFIASGNYEKSVSLNDTAEFGQLADEFNLMKKAVIEREHKIIYNASHDLLTDLPNRSYFIMTLEESLQNENIDPAIFIIKINHIKEINESLGYENGDKVIKVVSKRLASMTEVELLSHLRSDEFVILINSISGSSINYWIDQITSVLEKPFTTDSMTLHLQANIGVALSYKSIMSESDCTRTGNHPSNFLRMADSALQLARKNNRVFELYDKTLDEEQAERLNLMNDLHNAFDHNELQLFYQPKLDLVSCRVIHVEALIRWFHPEKGMIPPDRFISIAENTGQIDRLTLWVLDEAARQYSLWQNDNINISIAVNVSAQNLKSDNIYYELQSILTKYQLDKDALQLEVTESAVVENPESAIALLSKFKDSGTRLSIDDYGTGYSSLAQLKQLPVHELKIDMSFIRKLPNDEDDKIIVNSTIELAHNMGLSVVAEGVETEIALLWLKDHNCDIIQGYYISKPLPANEFTKWLLQSDYY